MYLKYVRYCSKCFAWIILFNILITLQIRKLKLNRLSNLPQITQLGSKEAKIQTQGSLASEPAL